MFRALTAWIDRDWERRSYSPLFLVKQGLMVWAPVVLAFLVVTMLQLPIGGPASNVLLILGVLGAASLFSLSAYRWFVGYGKSGRMKSRLDRSDVGNIKHG